MFVNTSPADYNNAESNSSLAFANRCKDITNAVSASGPGVQVRHRNYYDNDYCSDNCCGEFYCYHNYSCFL